MPEVTAKDAKLIQYLNEAYGKEKQLETALQAHIGMTTRAPYKKRLQRHLKETKEHARQVERRIKAIGGKADGVVIPGGEAMTAVATAATNVAQRAAAAATGPLHLLRGIGEQEKLLKNAKTEFQDEAEEIATYTAIETLADIVGDRETATLARGIRREEERMRDYLAKLIPQLTKAVATEEIPASERRTGTSRRRRSTSSRSRSTSSRSRTTSGGSRSRSTSSRSRSTSSRSRSTSGGSRSRSTGSRSRSTSGGSRSTSSRSRSSGSNRSRSGSGSNR